MSLFDRYGIKEVADVTFYELNTENLNTPGKPVLYLDTLKVSTVEQTAEAAETRGGKGNAALMAWDYGKEITVNLEDALFSAKSLEVIYGQDSKASTDSVTKHSYFTVKDIDEPFFIYDSQKAKYVFNSDKAAAFGLPWLASGHRTIKNNGDISLSFQTYDTQEGGGYPAEGIFKTGIPKRISNSNIKTQFESTSALGATGAPQTSLKASGTGQVTLKGTISPRQTSVTLQSSSLGGVSNITAVELLGARAKSTTANTYTTVNGATATLNERKQIVISGFSSSAEVQFYSVRLKVTFDEDCYCIVYSASLLSVTEGSVSKVLTGSWEYTESVGDGGIELTEANKKLTGHSYIVIGDKKISLKDPSSADLITSVIPSATTTQGAYLESGFYLFEVEIDSTNNENLAVREIEISANTFPGVYYVTADTFIRNEKTGTDELFQLIFPKVKIVPETNTITLEAEGDPTVFNLQLKVLKDRQAPMMQLVKYKPGVYRNLAVAGAALIIELEEGEIPTDAWIQTPPTKIINTPTTAIPQMVIGLPLESSGASLPKIDLGVNAVEASRSFEKMDIQQVNYTKEFSWGYYHPGTTYVIPSTNFKVNTTPDGDELAAIPNAEQKLGQCLTLFFEDEVGQYIATTIGSRSELIEVGKIPGKDWSVRIGLDGAGNNIYYDLWVEKRPDGRYDVMQTLNICWSWFLTSEGFAWMVSKLIQLGIVWGLRRIRKLKELSTLQEFGLLIVQTINYTKFRDSVANWLTDKFEEYELIDFKN